MGDALDDYYDRVDSLDTLCPTHKCWYDGSRDCPECEDELCELLLEDLPNDGS